jgi:hypothetical protein
MFHSGETRRSAGVLAIVEVKDKHLRQPSFGLEAAFVGRGGRVDVIRAFGSRV